MPAAMAIPSLISAGSSIIGGILGHNAASDAAKVQSQADQAAAQSVTKAAADVNPTILAAASKAGGMATDAAGNVMSTAATGAQNVNTAATNANAVLDPYSQAGQAAVSTLQKGLAPGGDFNKTPTLQDIQMDPGYAFRLQQGQLALQRSAAARGGGISGEALKDLTNYSQGAASQEYANAFNRYEQSTQNRYQNLFGVSNLGAATGTTQGANLLNSSQFGAGLTTGAANTGLGASEYAGTAGMNAADLAGKNTINAASEAAKYTTGAANSTAAGTVGGTNALTQGLTNAGNSLSSTANLSQLLKNPAT